MGPLHMIQMTLAQMANLLGLNTVSVDKEFQGLSIDTRTLQPGNLFIALPGSRVDGHDFIDKALQKGATAALVTHQIASPLPQFIVPDPVAALGTLAATWRQQYNIPIVAVTGSNGKTTLKNMISSIMVAACQNQDMHVLATHGTFNNHLGLPLTLARLNKQHRYAVIELGMSNFGEIEYLTNLTKPSVAVITNAAAAHLEGVGDIAGVARAKGEIFSGLSSSGMAILNRDDAFYTFWRELIKHRHYLTFGFHPDADVSVISQEHNAQQQAITIRTGQGNITLNLALLGKHNILNTLAAIATALSIGIDLEAIKLGIEKVKPAPGRLQLHSLANGVNIIDDTYNANPFSLQAAINTLATFSGKKMLVLGDMKGLGQDAEALHQAAAEAIRAAGIDYLFTYGELSATTAQAFGDNAYHFNDQKKLIDALKPFLASQITILIKGSRAMQMEKVVAELIQ